MALLRRQAWAVCLALLLALCGTARALEAGEFGDDIADLPGGITMKARLEGRAQAAAVALPSSADTGALQTIQSADASAGAAMQQSGSAAAGAFDLASQVAAAVGSYTETEQSLATGPAAAMVERLSTFVDVAIPDPARTVAAAAVTRAPSQQQPAATAVSAAAVAAAVQASATAHGSTVKPAAKPAPKPAAKPAVVKPSVPAKPAVVPSPKPATPVPKPVAVPSPKPAAVPSAKPATVPSPKPATVPSPKPAPSPPPPPDTPYPVVSTAALTPNAYTLPPTPLTEYRAITLGSLYATVGEKHGHRYYFQVPPAPRGVVLMIHGCAHSGANWFPITASCAECLPLPEQISHTVQALRRGYAVIALSSLDQTSGCWSWEHDSSSAAAAVNEWLAEQKLTYLPVYGLGVSSGAAFVLKLARFVKFSGLISEALGIEESVWGLKKIRGPYPPTVFISMRKDEEQNGRIQGAYEVLKRRGSPVAIVKSYPRKVYSTFFSDRDPLAISPALSAKIFQSLIKIGMIRADGFVTEDPRYTMRPWLQQLKGLVPELRATLVNTLGRMVVPFPPSPEDLPADGVWSLMNLAWNKHEIISDYCTAAFLWFESGGKSDLVSLLAKYTVSKPPLSAARRSSLELAAVPAEGAEGARDQQAHLQGAALSANAGELAAEAAAAEAALRGSAPSQLPLAAVFASGTISGAVIVMAVGGAVLLAMWRRQSSSACGDGGEGQALMAGAVVATHPAPRLPSIIPGVRERFELTEVVEQTGSPFSARRRVRTAFHADTPGQSPRKHPRH